MNRFANLWDKVRKAAASLDRVLRTYAGMGMSGWIILVILIILLVMGLYLVQGIFESLKGFVLQTEEGKLNLVIELIVGALGCVILLRLRPGARYTFLKQISLLIVLAVIMLYGVVFCLKRNTGKDVTEELRKGSRSRRMPKRENGAELKFPGTVKNERVQNWKWLPIEIDA